MRQAMKKTVPGGLLPQGKAVLRRLMALLSTVLTLSLPAACSGELSQASRELGLNLSAGQVVEHLDTHGGFHGDGRAYLELRFEGEAAEALAGAITGREGWEPLPLTANLSGAVDGCLSEDEAGKIPKISAIRNGFYCFLDRHSESTDEKDDSELFSRHSFNCSLAIYDLEEDTLYYFTLDT